MPLRNRSNERSLGFTLVELMITVVIVAILASLAVPSFIDLNQSGRTKGATENLASTFRAAQIEATRSNRIIVVSFQGSGTSTWCWGVSEVTACDCLNAPNACVFSNSGSTSRGVVSSGDYMGVTLTTTANFSFSPVRNTVNAGSVTLNGENGKQGRVVLSSFGRIRICTPTNDLGGYPSC